MVQKLLGFGESHPQVGTGNTSKTNSTGELPAWANDSDEEARAISHLDSIAKRRLNDQVGIGLVATSPIPAGQLVFADKVMCVSVRDQASCTTMRDAGKLIEAKARAMGSTWHRQFLELSCPKRESLGLYAGIWDGHFMRIFVNGRESGILGLNLAWVNHSCLPNCSLSLINVYPDEGEDGAGVVLTGPQRKPKLGRAVVRACREIRKNEEITVAYSYTKGAHGQRELFTWAQFGFVCVCRWCAKPMPLVEDAMMKHYFAERILNDPDTVDLRPAIALQTAFDVLGRLIRCHLYDARLAMLFVKCAMVAGYHSDAARATCFLSKARKMTFVLGGSTGVFYRQIKTWCDTISLMPGYATTTRGLSPATQGEILGKDGDYKEVLFMKGAKPSQYARVDQYCRLPDSVLDQVGSKFSVSSEEHVDLKKPTTPYTGAPNLSIEAKTLLHYATQATITNKDTQSSSGHKCTPCQHCAPKEEKKDRKPQRPRNPDCVDPEKDFLDLCLELKREYSHFFPKERKRSRRARVRPETHDAKADKGKGKETSVMPAVKDVTARVKDIKNVKDIKDINTIDENNDTKEAKNNEVKGKAKKAKRKSKGKNKAKASENPNAVKSAS